MNQMGEPVGVSGKTSPENTATSDLQNAQPETVDALAGISEGQAELVPVEPSPQPAKVQQASDREPVVADARLLTRILVGLLSSGSGELIRELRDLEWEIEQYPEFVEGGDGIGDEKTRDRLRYLALGLLMHGQRTAIRGIRNGFYFSLGTASRLFDTMDRMTSNRLMAPVRRPFASRLRKLGYTTAELIAEGQREERVSKVLAREALLEIIDEVVDLVSQNPEITKVIAEVVGGQGASLAGIMGDNARRLSLTSDDLVEGALRRVLRRTPRQALPRSPLAGEPQTMYSLETQEERNDHDER
jgi:hypothetical protein